MDSKDIIKGIEYFFRTADEDALAEVNAAFSVVIDGDVSLEEYLAGFSNDYFYSHSSSRNIYTYSNKHLNGSVQYSQQISFEDTVSNYEESDLVISLKSESDPKGQVAKMIKTAA